MELTKGQEKGLKMVVDLANGPHKRKVCVLAGVAGSGKTTLLKRIAEEIGTPVIIALVLGTLGLAVAARRYSAKK